MKVDQVLLSCLAPLAALAAPAEDGVGNTSANLDTLDLHAARQAVAASPYAPVPAKCPSTPLVRKATGVSSQEAAYVEKRKVYSDYAIRLFLLKTGAKFPKLKDGDYPTAALLTSGGGLRSLLSGAGVVKSFDGREGLETYKTAGLYQAMTYEAGLSGGGWLLSSLAANNYPTISWLYKNLWSSSFNTGPFVPGSNNSAAYAQILQDTTAKQAAGFEVSIADPYGREIAYEILQGSRGGIKKHFSDITTLSNFTNHLAPFPIITALGVDTSDGECKPMNNATQYEFSPYEFGSWDKGIAAFTPTKYLGSSLSNGKPVSSSSKACVNGFDSTSLVIGTTSDIYPAITCPTTSFSPNMSTTHPLDLLPRTAQGENNEVFALYPNPFYKYSSSPEVSASKRLTLADGGLGNQNNPIWPFLHRPGVDVLFVNDNSADTNANYPNGTELHVTYQQAQLAGLGRRMPAIPTPDVFVARGLNTRPTVFGCNSDDPQKLVIVFIPNVGYGGYNAGISTFMLRYTPEQSAALLANGAKVGSFNGAAGWDTCLACFLVKKKVKAQGGTLPAECSKCFSQHCYN